jgi:hypothetical protein
MTVTKFAAGLTIQASATWPVPALLVGASASPNRFAQQIQMLSSLTNGTGTGKADSTIYDIRQLAAAGTETLNFFDGSVLLVDGSATGLQTVKQLIIYQIANPDGTTAASSFTVGNAAATQLVLNLGAAAQTWTGYMDSVPFWAGRKTGYTVDASNKSLKILNNDGANKLTYVLLVEGNHV